MRGCPLRVSRVLPCYHERLHKGRRRRRRRRRRKIMTMVMWMTRRLHSSKTQRSKR
jgi:hypothetical protein